MKEYAIKLKAREYFEKKGYRVWFPPKVRYKMEIDIFGIWDGVAWKENKFVFFQLTTAKNKAARLRKVADYMLKHFLSMNSPAVKGQVMAWHLKRRCFIIVEV